MQRNFKCPHSYTDVATTDSVLAMIMQEEEHDVASQQVYQDTDLDHATAQKIQKEEEKRMEREEFQRLQVLFKSL